MEKASSDEQKDLMIKQLIEGIEAAKQLQKRILISSATNHDYQHINHDHDHDHLLNHSLLDTMLSAFDTTISIAKLINVAHLPYDHHHQHQSGPSIDHSLPLSSPRSENSHHFPSKKRKTMPRWSKKVNVGAAVTIAGLEGALDDGYSWRKYGQKEILGAKYPRGYYKCTHRNSQQCPATKQVQRSDDDSSIYQVIYNSNHTCTTGSKAQSKPNKAQIKAEPSPQSFPGPIAQSPVPHSPEQEVYVGLGPDGSLKVEPTDNNNPTHFFRSFSFSPTLLESGPIGPIDSFLMDCPSTFGSPETSDSNNFLVKRYRVNGADTGVNVQTSESDLNGSISGPNSVSNSPIGCDFEFLLDLDQLGNIEADFPFF